MTLSDHSQRIQKVIDALAKEPESERLKRVLGNLEDARYWLQAEKEARMVARANQKQARKDEQDKA